MVSVEITRDEILAVYPKVAQTIADALGSDLEKVALNVPLVEGLGADSLDFLDIGFRLEQAFAVGIPQNKIIEDAQGDLLEAEFECRGYLTEVGLERLRNDLSEVPADRFRLPMKVADVPRLFTTETLCKVVARALRAAQCGDSRSRGPVETGAPTTDG
jgi:acyl carrier protein